MTTRVEYIDGNDYSSTSVKPPLPHATLAGQSLEATVELAGMDVSEVVPSLGIGLVPILLGRCSLFVVEHLYRHLLDAIQSEKGGLTFTLASKSQNVASQLPTAFTEPVRATRRERLDEVFGSGPGYGRDLDWAFPVDASAALTEPEAGARLSAKMSRLKVVRAVDRKVKGSLSTALTMGDDLLYKLTACDGDCYTACDAASVLFGYLCALPVRPLVLVAWNPS